MKKFRMLAALALCAVLLVSLMPIVFAADAAPALQFDENGYPRMYVFKNCRAFIRTVPLMLYSQTRPEDLDTAMEDHVCDEWRYFCMSRPVKPMMQAQTAAVWSDPLNQIRS